jgi:imidazolonepropionase-like amidohydrolase
MRRHCPAFTVAAVGIGAALSAAAGSDDPGQTGTVVFKGARIHVVSGPVIDRGVLIIRGGKIVAVGPEGQVTIPDGAPVRSVAGKVIIPGLVDTHSHVGIYPRPAVPAHSDGNEMSGPVQAGLRALDAIFPDDPGIRMAVAGGITTANVMPGSGNAIGGQTLYVKFRGQTIDEMRIKDMKVLGGLKMANGENPKGYGRRPHPQAPMTRMKVAALQREQFIKARDYQHKWAAYGKAVAAGKKDATMPERDLSLDPLVEVLERKRTVHFHTHRADDLMTALRIAEEFNFEIVLQHATEGFRIVDELVRRKIPVSLTLVDSPGGKMETAGLLEENAAILQKAGVNVAINTDDFITESRFFLRTGAIAVRGGMPPEAALRALTLNAARMLHLEDRLGALAAGKDADFVILSGDPFSVYTHVLETYIDGKRVFNRAEQNDWKYQAGGFALPTTERVPRIPEDAKPLRPVRAPVSPAGQTTTTSPKQLTILAGRIHTVTGPPILDGAVLVEGGKIRYVGPRRGLPEAKDAVVLTAAEVTPGLIDAHAVVPITGLLNIPADQEQDEHTDPNQAELRVLDGFNPNEPLLEFLRQQGVTVIQAMPGRVNAIAGQGGVFRTSGRTAEMMTIRFPSALLINLGEIPKTAYTGKLPATRMGTSSLIRSALTQAQNDVAKRAAAKDPDKLPARNLKLEALALALERKIPCYFSAHRADDLVTGLRLAHEFRLKPVLDLATEGYLIADLIAAEKTPVVVHPTMQRIGSSMETLNSQLCNATVLAEKNLPIALSTSFEGYVPKTRVLRHEAALAMVHGLGFDRALRAVTLDAARLLEIQDRFGSLDVGKTADLVLYDGDPFEHATHVTNTVIGGRIVFDRAEYLKLPFERRALTLTSGSEGCCLGIW